MILNNNQYMNFAEPRAYLKRAGLAGLTDFGSMTMDNVSQGMTALNSEAVFLINLQRAREGLPPLNVAASSPTVNVAMSPETRNMLLVGAAGLLGVLLLAKRR